MAAFRFHLVYLRLQNNWTEKELRLSEMLNIKKCRILAAASFTFNKSSIYFKTQAQEFRAVKGFLCAPKEHTFSRLNRH